MPAPGFLHGVRVIDLSQYAPGPFATRQLADLGADVIKIEPPQGDPMRFFMHREADQVSPIYRHLNRGKRVCKLDLKTEQGKNKLRKLLGDADILLESYRPDVLARLGFDRDHLDQINPRLIHCALSGFGQTGPYRLRAGHDINYNALSSVQTLSGTIDQPVICYPPMADHAAALQAGVAMLAALYSREHTNRGSYLDISIFESILSWQYMPILTHSSERASDILNGGAACYNLYQCADGLYISLGALEPAFWENFCSSVDKPQWKSRQFESMPQKVLIGEVAETIASQTQAYWKKLLEPVNCCFEPLCFPDDLGDNEQVLARQALSDCGPSYAGWIDHQPLAIDVDFEEFDAAQGLAWKTT